MGNCYGEPKHLTQEEAILVSEDFLWGSKVEMRNIFKLVQECIQNDDWALNNTKCTNTVISKGGDNFFIAHI